MKYFFLVILISGLSVQSFAQQNHFIYIQTENNQPFYVRVSDRLLSSSSTGYVVVPKLQNGSYELNIGFPKNEWPMQRIRVNIKDRDAGYVLKNFDDKGWGLFNMQTLDIVMSTGNKATEVAKVEDADGFADVLSEVVSTPSIKQKPVEKEKKVEPKAVTEVKTAVTEVKATNPGVKDTDAETKIIAEAKADIKEKEDTKTVAVSRPAIKIFTILDNTGRSIVYVDSYENKMDTIRVFIPYEKAAERDKPAPLAAVKEEPKQEIKQEPVNEKKEEGKFVEPELPDPNAVKETAPGQDTVKKETPKLIETVTATPVQKDNGATAPMLNSDCKDNAGDKDFLKLRKKMAAQKSDENMIVVAKKAFVFKCYTTEQISNLSVLFLKDEGRYNFFDAAYPRVSDSQHFGNLVSKLTDEYFINRFNAMIRH